MENSITDHGPVILYGSQYGVNDSGHTWVADGYKDWESGEESFGGAFIWLSQLVQGVFFLRSNPELEIEDKDTLEDIQLSLTFWQHITDPTSIIGPLSTKSGGGIINNPIEDGHWELMNVYSEVVEYATTKLTPTSWNQVDGYNLYCPYKSNSTEERAPAGCAAVAGAQMFYYLHSELGAPAAVPSYAYCSGNVNGYTMYQNNATTTVWNNMSLGYASDASDVLIAHIGTLLGMHYGDDGSWVISSLTKLRDDVFSVYGISSMKSGFDENTVRNQLLAGMPVICSAFPSNEQFLNLPNLAEGHVFIIDGYKRERVRHTYVYEWVYDNVDPEQMVDLIEPIIEISYSWRVTDQISMNWGWGGAYNNIFFSYTGDWNVDGYNFEFFRNILHNFAVIE